MVQGLILLNVQWKSDFNTNTKLKKSRDYINT